MIPPSSHSSPMTAASASPAIPAPAANASSSGAPASSQPSPAAAQRPAYSSHGTRPLRTAATKKRQPIDSFSPFKGNSQKIFHFSSLRARLMVHIAALATIALVFIGSLLATTGIIEINKSEAATIDGLYSDLYDYARDATKPDSAHPLTTASQVLRGFLGSKPPISGSSMLAFVNGSLRMHQATKDSPAYDDKQLVAKIRARSPMDNARQFRIATDRTTYTVGAIPLKVGSTTGMLAIVLDHDGNAAHTWNIIRMFIGISMTALVLILLVTWRMAGKVFSPIGRLERMMHSIASGDDLSKRLPVQGDIRLQEMALNFNGMIDRLQDSFESQHHLLNDIGHELRTPLTVIHGHVELMNPDNRDDVIHTQGLVLDEIDRMHRMTEDLVTVSTMHRPDFVRPKPMLVPDLTLDVFEHARQLSNNSWRLSHVADVEINADYQRLIQAFLQLCQNASKFTEPTSVIEIGSHIDKVAQVVDLNGTVHPTQTVTAPPNDNRPYTTATHFVYLWVRDHGVGIEPINQSRIFERFARVDHTRPGSGLGLSIVDAIAQAHGGWLEVQSVHGVGSVFAMALPIADEYYAQREEGE